MKRLEQSVLLAGVLAIGLTACTKDRMGGEETASTSAQVNDNTYGTPQSPATTGLHTDTSTAQVATPRTTPNTPTGPSPASVATPVDPMDGTGAQATADTRIAPNSVVTMIEAVPRAAGTGTGSGAVGSTGAAGATGSSSDRNYRITLRMDDGSTQVITQDWAPTFRSGDRVNLSAGEIQRR